MANSHNNLNMNKCHIFMVYILVKGRIVKFILEEATKAQRA